MAFKTGLVVQLKSGGPLMTVAGYGQDGNGNVRVNCTWFNDKQDERNGAYPEDAPEEYKEGAGIWGVT